MARTAEEKAQKKIALERKATSSTDPADVVVNSTVPEADSTLNGQKTPPPLADDDEENLEEMTKFRPMHQEL
jgi:hypothetical protein